MSSRRSSPRLVQKIPAVRLALFVALGLCVGSSALPPAARAQPIEEEDLGAVRLEMEVLGRPVQIEVRDLPQDVARDAIRRALLDVHAFAVLVEPGSLQPGSLADINRRAGTAVAVDPRVYDFVLHGLRYCLWSNNAHGPLGGQIYRVWEDRRSGKSFDPHRLRDAVESAGCDNIAVDQGPPATIRIAESSRLYAFGLGLGFAFDLAADRLRAEGVTNAILETDQLIRAIGPGPGGRGWLVQIPGAGGSRHPLDQFFLREQSVAWISAPGAHGESAQDSLDLTPINQRNGVPTQGIVQVVSVTEMAADAEALNHALYALGYNLGQRHVGMLNPRPSIFWLLGSGVGQPLESPYRWSELNRPY